MRCVKPLYRLDAVRYRDYIDNFAPFIRRWSYKNKGYITNAYTLKAFVPEDQRYRFEEIPCGRCINCRLNRQREWALRCTLEAKRYPLNLFVTLTYDDNHLPIYRHSDDGVSELRRRDLSLYLKRVREYCRREFGHTGVRYFGCGEYGELSDRAHYHLVLFNLPPQTELKQIGSSSGYPLFTVPWLEKCWSDKDGVRLGFVTCAYFSSQTASYVAGYVLKKKLGADRTCFECKVRVKARFAGLYRRKPRNRILKYIRKYIRSRAEPFICMSTHPGIGYQDDLASVIYDDALVVKQGEKVVQTPPFRYLKKLADKDPELSDHIAFVSQERKDRRDGTYLSDEDLNAAISRSEASRIKAERIRKRLL